MSEDAQMNSYYQSVLRGRFLALSPQRQSDTAHRLNRPDLAGSPDALFRHAVSTNQLARMWGETERCYDDPAEFNPFLTCRNDSRFSGSSDDALDRYDVYFD